MHSGVWLQEEAPNTVSEVWNHAVDARGSMVALWDARDGSAFTLQELDGLIRRGAAWLRARGLGSQDRLVIVAAPSVETLLVAHAALWTGIVPVVLPADSPAARVREVQAACGSAPALLPRHDPSLPEALVLDDSALEQLLGQSPLPRGAPVSPDQEALVLFSSGSTGPARGVRISHAALCEGITRLHSGYPRRPGERHGVPALLHTITGFRLPLLRPALLGAPTVLLSPRAPPAQLFEECRAQEVEVLHTSPGLVQAVNLAPARFERPPTLRVVIIGGGPLTVEQRTEFARSMGVLLVHTYGATETAGAVCSSRVWPDGTQDPGLGRPLVPLQIVDEQGHVQPAGHEGWVELSPRAPFLGYLNGEQPPERDGRRWLRLGDLGALDEEGCLHLRGRAMRQHICPTGEKVMLDDLEQALGRILGVELLVVTVQAPRRAASIGVWVGLDRLSDAWLARARAAIAEQLPPFAWPSLWWAGGPLPRLPGGKPDHLSARQRLEALP